MIEKVMINGDRITITDLEDIDRDGAGVLDDRVGEQCEDLVRRAMRIGTLAIRDAAVGVNVDVIQKVSTLLEGGQPSCSRQGSLRGAKA